MGLGFRAFRFYRCQDRSWHWGTGLLYMENWQSIPTLNWDRKPTAWDWYCDELLIKHLLILLLDLCELNFDHGQHWLCVMRRHWRVPDGCWHLWSKFLLQEYGGVISLSMRSGISASHSGKRMCGYVCMHVCMCVHCIEIKKILPL